MMPAIRRFFSGCAVIACLFAASSASADESRELPLWELGLGFTGISVPYYRGAADNRQLVLPFVYPIYRGERLRVDNRGIRGRLFKSDRVRLDLSADAGTPGDSEDIEGREGMSDLDPTIQFGPSLDVTLWRDPTTTRSLTLNMPLRAVGAIDSGINGIGYTFAPHLTYSQPLNVMGRRFRMGLSGGLEFGSGAYHDYYYGVSDADVTSTRSAYDPDSGYAGTRFSATLVSRQKNNLMTFFARYDRVEGAEFEDSPLVRRKDGLTIGFAIAWFVARSKTMVPSGRR